MVILFSLKRNRICASLARHHLLVFFLLLIPDIGLTQTDSVRERSFRYYNPDDKQSVFLENKSRALPRTEDSTYSITITVKNIRNTNGVIRFKFYDDSTPFPHDEGFLRIVVPKSEVISNTFTATYHGFMTGYMGIALHDDENSNRKLDFDWFLPGEGYAFSDYYHSSILRPRFSSFRFLLTGNRQVVMIMKYH
jgi:uncharacterized protein (DUF2141 family)